MSKKEYKLIREIKAIIDNPDLHFWIKCKQLVKIKTYDRPGSNDGRCMVEDFFKTCAGKYKDRFESAVAVFEDEPKVLYVLRWKMSGLNFVSHKDVLGNHNNLHSNFKKAYENLLDQLKANNIDFELNSESY